MRARVGAPRTRGVVRRALSPRAHPPAAAVNAAAAHARAGLSSSAATAATGDDGGGGVCPTVLIKRQFLLQVHPDFFSMHAKERTINGENLKLLNNHLDPPNSSPRFPFPTPTTTSSTTASPRNLTFYLKPSSSTPPRVTVPLDRDRGRVFSALRDILQAHCKGLALPTLPPTAPPRAHAHAHQPPPPQQQQQQQHQHDWQSPSPYDFRYSDAWARARANARRRQRAWQQQQQQQGWVPEEEEEGFDVQEEEDERPPPFLDLYLEAAARREGKWGTMRARRAASAEVGRRVAALKAQWGFEGIDLRVDWAAEHLLVTLQRLEEALAEYYGGADAAAFGGLELVVMQHDIVRDTALDASEGRLLLCPSDPPLRWVAALEGATPQTLRRIQALRRREAALVRAVQNMALPGAVVERGLTCSRRQYRAFLRRCLLNQPSDPSVGAFAAARASLWDVVESDGDESEGDEEEEEGVWIGQEGAGGGGLPSRPWKDLRLRVERGVRPTVLESGALQVDAPRVRSHGCLHALVERLFPAAQEAGARHHEASARLRELELWCQHPGSSLGLTSITREATVSVGEATRCLERLLALPGDHPVGAALKGVAVGGRVVVGKAGYGWTREGVLRLPWDWDVARR